MAVKIKVTAEGGTIYEYIVAIQSALEAMTQEGVDSGVIKGRLPDTATAKFKIKEN